MNTWLRPSATTISIAAGSSRVPSSRKIGPSAADVATTGSADWAMASVARIENVLSVAISPMSTPSLTATSSETPSEAKRSGFSVPPHCVVNASSSSAPMPTVILPSFSAWVRTSTVGPGSRLAIIATLKSPAITAGIARSGSRPSFRSPESTVRRRRRSDRRIPRSSSAGVTLWTIAATAIPVVRAARVG